MLSAQGAQEQLDCLQVATRQQGAEHRLWERPAAPVYDMSEGRRRPAETFRETWSQLVTNVLPFQVFCPWACAVCPVFFHSVLQKMAILDILDSFHPGFTRFQLFISIISIIYNQGYLFNDTIFANM